MPRRRLPDMDETRRILAEKRSKPLRRTGRPASAAVAPLLKGFEARFGPGPLLQSRWREIAGETLSRRTEPVRVVKGRAGLPGVLEVKVDGAAATLIQHQSGELIQKVNLFLGEGTVGKLRIVQGPVRPPAASAGSPGPAAEAKARRRPPPLSAAQEAQLAQGLAEAEDGPLKRALERLGRAVLRRDGPGPR